MLIRITTVCDMGCPHCLVDARPDGVHMDAVTFRKALEFVDRIPTVKMVMLSGGEPTLHPQLLDFIALARREGAVVSLLSNGDYLKDVALATKIHASGALVQITNDERFYPRALPTLLEAAFPQVSFTRRIRQIMPLGRAKTMTDLQGALPQKAPSCFNLRSIARYLVARQPPSLADAVCAVRKHQRFCVPSVDPDGSVRAGESPFCYRLGRVTDSMGYLGEKLCAMSCDNCGLTKNLTPEQKTAIGVAP